MFNIDSIRDWTRNNLTESLSKLTKEQLIDHIIELHTAIYPFNAVLGAIVEDSGGYTSVSSGLFPLLDDNENYLTLNRGATEPTVIGKDIPTSELHAVDYFKESSIPIDDGTKLNDAFVILSAFQSVSVASIFCGTITARDVRHLEKVLQSPRTT